MEHFEMKHFKSNILLLYLIWHSVLRSVSDESFPSPATPLPYTKQLPPGWAAQVRFFNLNSILHTIDCLTLTKLSLTPLSAFEILQNLHHIPFLLPQLRMNIS